MDLIDLEIMGFFGERSACCALQRGLGLMGIRVELTSTSHHYHPYNLARGVQTVQYKRCWWVIDTASQQVIDTRQRLEWPHGSGKARG